MKKIALVATTVLLLLQAKSQQNTLSEDSIIPVAPGIIKKDGKVVGQNENSFISALAKEYKANADSRNIDSNVMRDFQSWWLYNYKNINFEQDFVGITPDSKMLNKRVFLQLLTTGEFYPTKTETNNGLPCYKLNILNVGNADIRNTLIQLAGDALFYYNMEGKELPNYRFEDIAGHIYNNANTKGKILVLKCWFIHCVACVREFPQLNKLVENYSNTQDILFISLAFDQKKELTNFLKTHKFKYSVVANQEGFMTEKLGIISYPTHIIIGKDGKIAKVLSSYENLAPALKKIIAK